jgi:hypothetical protein
MLQITNLHATTFLRHCEEPKATRQSSAVLHNTGLLRFARNDGVRDILRAFVASCESIFCTQSHKGTKLGRAA